jgi:hypothetical protein
VAEVIPTQQLVTHSIAEEPLRVVVSCVADDDGVAFVDDHSVNDAGVVRCTSTAPTPSFDLEGAVLVGELKHAL